jgi:hypothetical protein
MAKRKLPIAEHRGHLDLGGPSAIECCVLDNGQQLITCRTTVQAITGKEHGGVVEITRPNYIKPFLPSHLQVVETVPFKLRTPGGLQKARGLSPEQFVGILRAYVEALAAGALRTPRQIQVAGRCAVIQSALSVVGLVAMIDEATGAQMKREENALQRRFALLVAEEPREWSREYPQEFWMQLKRLTGYEGDPRVHRPRWWGNLVLELIYRAIDPNLAAWLKQRQPSPSKGANLHQWLTEHIGLAALRNHIQTIIVLARTCGDLDELRARVAVAYHNEPLQLSFYNIDRAKRAA